SITGIDLSEKMLEIARIKAARVETRVRLSFAQGDAEHLPFPDGAFDLVTVAFGVRNFEDLPGGLAEMMRVLRKGGTLMILEFSHPDKRPLRQLYNAYSRLFIPLAGRMISGHRGAYRYLPESVRAFPSGKNFLKILEETGMTRGSMLPLTGGIATIYSAEKP
ncbi:MAG TPA: ubiquinone/menaquinone biosynthesis methyltransferase, partial [Bacteroidales bacterium]|nr:ubiquinone/menaquinone biosynthesis methyltransferase [Bacteroidales bacterium]